MQFVSLLGLALSIALMCDMAEEIGGFWSFCHQFRYYIFFAALCCDTISRFQDVESAKETSESYAPHPLLFQRVSEALQDLAN